MAVRAAGDVKTVPLANCRGAIGFPDLPSLSLTVGQRASILGLSAHTVLTAAPAGIVQVEGTTIVAVSRGTARVGVEGEGPVSPCRDESNTCDLVRVDVT